MALSQSTQSKSLLFKDLEVDPNGADEPFKLRGITKGTPPSRGDRWRYQTYDLPDEEDEAANEVDFEDLQWKTVFNGGLHLSPDVPTPKHTVLEIGTGPGNWAIEYATSHPEATVVAADVILHHHKRFPINCHFVQADFEKGWNFGQQFNFVHARDLIAGIRDWPQFLKRAYDTLLPGGYLELAEPQFPLSYIDDGSVKTNSPLFVWSHLINLAAQQLGLDTLITLQLERMLKEAGFINVRVEWVRLPSGTWAQGQKEKEMGWCTVKNTERLLRPLAQLLYTQGLGWREASVDAFLNGVQRDLESGKGHYFWHFGVFSAQKPMVSPWQAGCSMLNSNDLVSLNSIDTLTLSSIDTMMSST